MESTELVITKAYQSLDRTLFLNELKELAGVDAPLPIGYGQTISQPSLVLFMTLALKPFMGCSVLEIGTGSGYQTALLAAFAKEVYTVERIEPLYNEAKNRLHMLGYDNVHLRRGDGWTGWPEHAHYDRILVTAAAPEIPESLCDQLAPGGIMVIPIGAEGEVQELVRLEKDADGIIEKTVLELVRFVPLVRD